MNVLKRLALKNLKMNKKRTISTVIGIILSTALICGTATLVTSFQETLIRHAINETGYYHVKLNNITEDEAKDIEKNRDVDTNKILKTEHIGYGVLPKSKNESKPYVNLQSMDKKTFDALNLELIEGRFPENKNEIIVSKHIITNGEVELKIGDKVSFDIGKRQSLDGDDLNPKNYYNEEEGEQLVNKKKYDFTIVGIIERPNYGFEARSDAGYTIITTGLQNDEKKCDMYLALKNPANYETDLTELLRIKFIFRG